MVTNTYTYLLLTCNAYYEPREDLPWAMLVGSQDRYLPTSQRDDEHYLLFDLTTGMFCLPRATGQQFRTIQELLLAIL